MTKTCAAAVILALSCGAAAAARQGDPVLARAFRAECAARSKAADEAGTMTVTGADGWLFFDGELRHVAAGEFWGEAAEKASRAAGNKDPLPAILDYHAQCDKLGIELILLPVPPKAVVYADKLCARVRPDAKGVPPRLDEAHQAFYKLLREKGVTVLDLTDDFLAARARKGAPPMYCKQDTHWSGRACIHAAGRITERVRDRPWVRAIRRRPYASEDTPVRIRGDLWRDLKGAKPPRETLPLRFVGTKGAMGLVPPEPDANAPVLLLADSHGLVFHLGGDMHARGAGLPDQLALAFGCPIERVAVKGSGATPARISLYRKQKRLGPAYLKSKKLILWCFAARELTESAGWRKVPVTRSVPR